MAETSFDKSRYACLGMKPFNAFERMIAMRYLRARRKETFISVISGFSFLGIMLGVATLIVVMAVMNGFREELLSKILGINGHLVLRPIERSLTDYDQVADKVSNVEGVRVALPFVEGQALASGVNASQGVLVRGMRDQDIVRLQGLEANVKLGSLDNFAEQQGVAIGRRLATSLGLALGDNLTLVTPRGNVTPFGVTPRIKAYPVVAIFELGMSEFDSLFVYMPLEEAQVYFNTPTQVTGIDVYLEEPDEVGVMREPVEAAADRPVMSIDWRQRNVTFFSALEVERNVMFLILTMIVLVAALNIVSGLIMLVKDKGRNIAILRTMGASRGAIMRIFFMTGASIGVMGTLSGFLLGVIICLNVESIRQAISAITRTELFSPELYYLSKLPATIDPFETAMVIMMALGLSFLATLYPAWRAARLDPVEALRYE
jgi:lipoprotein-releasing system permease protein